jgi:hypothetical protein
LERSPNLGHVNFAWRRIPQVLSNACVAKDLVNRIKARILKHIHPQHKKVSLKALDLVDLIKLTQLPLLLLLAKVVL